MKRLLIFMGWVLLTQSALAQTIFGTTSAGGDFGKGTVYSMGIGGSGYTVLHHFNESDGSQPMGTLTLLPNGKLAGVCYQGGDHNVSGTYAPINNGGVIFSLNQDGTNFEVLHSFNLNVNGYDQGEKPSFGVLLASDGRLYGTTTAGGLNGGGILYRINTDGSGFQVLLNFNSPASIKGIPIEIPGNFVVFSFSQSATYYGTGLIKYDMNDPNPGFSTPVIMTPLTGFTPGNTPVLMSDGKLYGTTFSGGINNRGFIYRVDLSQPLSFTTLFSFPTGIGQYAQLVEGQDGLFYGTFAKGSAYGGVFKFDKNQSAFTIINETVTSGPVARVSQLTSGNLVAYNNSSAFNSNPGYNNDYIFSIDNDGANFTSIRSLGVSSAVYGFVNLSETRLLIHSSTQQSQTISFTLPSSIYIGAPPYLINGSSTSGMDLLYVSSNPNVVRVINGKSLIGLSTGTATITAYQLGNYEFLPATTVAQSISVVGPPPLVLDSLALVDIYNSSNGPGWTNSSNWLSGPVSSWHGVTVVGGRVTGINLYNNNLTGPIPSTLSTLTGLTSLILGDDMIGGNIPSSIGNLTQLETLQLSFCDLTGAIPPSMGNLTQLSTLILNNNQLTGDIPASFSTLVNLVTLDLSFNMLSGGYYTPGLSGQIPEIFSNMAELVNLNLSFNSFTGSLPDLSGLAALQQVQVNNNDLSQIPPLSGLTGLISFNASNNRLSFESIEANILLSGFVFSPQKSIYIPDSNPTVTAGEPYSFSVSIGGSANRYQWFKNGIAIPGATQNTYTIAPTVLTDQASYFVRATSTLVPTLTLESDLIAFIVLPSEPYFQNITTGDIVADTPTSSYGGYWADYDNDGDEDLFVNNYLGSVTANFNYFYENQGNGTFSKVTSGLFSTEYNFMRSATWGDYDNDGDLDLFVGDNASAFTGTSDGISAIYKNNGDKTFTSIPIPQTSEGGSWADYDRDGDLDLAVFHSANNTVLYRNNGNDQFIANGSLINSSTTWTLSWTDVDNDGDVDFFQPGSTGTLFNRLYINDGLGSLTENTSSSIATDNLNARGSSWGDMDNDGLVDLILLSQSIDSKVYWNNGHGTFTNGTSLSVFGENIRSRASSLGDVDNDGDLDFFTILSPGVPTLFRNNGNRTFTKETSQTFYTANIFSQLSMADYDNDGYLDLFVGNQNAAERNYLYRNQGGANNWIKFKLTGTVSNRSAIGARVVVKANGIWQSRQVMTLTGLASQNSLLVHVGLGSATVADSVKIFWPNGNTQVVTNLPSNQLHSIIEFVPPPLANGDLLNGSTLATVADEIKMQEWLGDSTATGTLLFRKSRDGASAFHSLCDNQGLTITIVKNNLGKTFGGFATIPWTSGSGYFAAPGSFLFSITNQSKHELGGIQPNPEQIAVYHGGNYGPTFGGGHDLYIQGDMSYGYTNLGHTYICSEGTYASEECRNSFAGAFGFTIDEVEVFRIKFSQTINIDTVNTIVGGQPLVLPAFSNAGLPITYVSSDNLIIEFSGSNIYMRGVGTCTITASQPGDDKYNPAAPVSWSITAVKSDQTITFNALPDKEVGDVPFDLGATSSSGLPVIYTSSNDSVAVVIGNQLRLVGMGTALITAMQPGDSLFNAADSVSQMITVNPGGTRIYGITYQNGVFNGGTLYTIKPDGTGFTELHDFEGPIGRNPQGQLIKFGSKLAGITMNGGSNNKGVIYSINIDGTAYTVLYNFYSMPKSNGLFLASDGKVYAVDGTFLVMINEDGTLSTISPACFSDNYQAPNWNTFVLSQTNAIPSTLKVYVNGVELSSGEVIYDENLNAVFVPSFRPGSGDVQINFCVLGPGSLSTEGATSFSPLIELPTGELAGAARDGGANGYGYYFKVNKDGSGFTKLYDFTLDQGANPTTLILASDGKIYVTCTNGGYLSGYVGGFGSIVSFNADGTNPIEIFDWTDAGSSIGKQPYWGLTEGYDGQLYGTTSFHNGNNPSGLVYKIRKDGTGYTPLYYFDTSGTTGATPLGGIAQLTNGSLLGTTYSGGISPGGGGLFKINPDGTDFTSLKYFDTNTGTNPSLTVPLLVYTESKKIQSITFSLPSPVNYTSEPIALPVTSDSGLPIIYTSSNPSVASIVNGSTLKINSVGSVTITAAQPGNYEFTPATIVQQTIVFTKIDQTITFNPIPSKTLEDPDFTLSGFSSAHLLLTYTSSDTTVAQVAGNTLKLMGAGTATINASQPGNAFYNAAATITQDITITEPLPGTEKLLFTLAYGSAQGQGAVMRMNTDGSDLVAQPFGATDGNNPVARLTLYDGVLYGTNYVGGANGYGTIFRVNPDGSDYVTLHQFNYNDGANPWAALMAGHDGYLYGTTISGGASGYGVAFRIYPDGFGFEKLHDFGTDGSNPYGELLEALDGKLYGTTYLTSNGSPHGTIFRMNKDGSEYSVIHYFDNTYGAYPFAGLVQDSEGRLYGTTNGGYNGTSYSAIYSINPAGSNYTVIGYLYGSTGQGLFAKLLLGKDDKLYGTAHSGGNYGTGTVFSINRDGSGFAKLHEFTNDQSQGSYPYNSSLVQSPDGTLYGTTLNGGTNNNGTIFSISTQGFAKLFDFTNTEGGYPYSDLILDENGQLFGTTYQGGTFGGGVIFRFATSGNTYTKLKEFGNNQYNGAQPFGGIEQTNAGEYFGTTYSGGNSGSGTIFKLTKYGTRLTKTFDFSLASGGYPYSGLSKATDGKLYGLTSGGGTYSRGVSYSINSDGTNFNKIFEFSDATGGLPVWGGIMQSRNGKLYGQLNSAVFNLNPDGTEFTRVMDFNGSNGNDPRGKLVEDVNGSRYGVTWGGGYYGHGTIFKVGNDDSFTTIYHFNNSNLDGFNPGNGLVLGLDGSLYGTTHNGGTNNLGVIFKLNTDGSNYTKIYEFTGANGANPFNGLAQGQDSTLYGAALGGGMYGLGVIYKIKPDGSGYERLLNLSNQLGYHSHYPILVGKVPGGNQTITFNSLAAVTYGDAPLSLSATSSSGLPVSFISSDSTVVSVNGNVATIKGAGSVTITANQPGNGIYSPAVAVSQVLIINKAVLTATAQDTTKVYGNPNPAFAFEYLGFVNSDNASGIDNQPMASTLVTDTTSVGTYPITLVGGDDNNYSFSYVDGTLTIVKADQSIVFSPIQQLEPTDPPFTLDAIATSGLQVQYTSSDTTIVKITGSLATILGEGIVTITASQPGNNNYNAALAVSQTIDIQPVLAPEPLNNASGLVFNPVSTTQMTLTFNPGDGARHLVVIRSDTPVSFQPTDGTSYTLNQDLGNNQRVVSTASNNVILITGLLPNKLYHVKIFEYNGEGSSANYLLPGALGSRTTLALPNVFVTSPANNATGLNVTLNITARTLTGATTYTLQISPQSDFSSGIIERSGGRTQSFSGLSFGTVYYTRVKTNLSPDFGQLTQFTTGGAEQFAFVSSPANNATGVVLNNLGLNVTSNTVIGAVLYTIELNTSLAFDGISVVSTGTRTRPFTGLSLSTTYYSRVRTNLSPNWGPTRQFTTATAQQLSYMVTPGNNATNVAYNPTVTANNVGATQYTIQLSPVADFSSGVIQNSGPSRTMSFTGLLFDTQYYSRVSTDLDLAWGPVRTFTTNNSLFYSYMTSPANGATNVNYNTNISCNTVPGATQYTIEANTQPDFSGISIVNTGPTRTLSFQLGYNQVYYVRVQTNLMPGQWGQVRSFTTTNPLNFSYMTSPINGATNINYVTNITANTVPGATQYIIEADTQSDFLSGGAILKMGAGRTYSFQLSPDQTYYVRVQTNLLPGQYGQVRSFTTGNAVTLAYVTSPINGGTGVPTTVNVTANSLSGATSYSIELNPDSGFGSGTSIVKTGSRTQNFSNLLVGTTYYSRVQTNLAPGQWGEVRSFTTIDPAARTNGNWVGEEDSDIIYSGELKVSTYPNPFQNKFTVLVESETQEFIQFQLIDLTGKIVRDAQEETNHLFEVNGDFAPGTYLLKVITSNGVIIKRIVRV